MSLALIIGAGLSWWFVVTVAKELHAEAKHRWEDEVMAEYLKEEETRAHIQRLSDIDTTVRATTEELDRIAAEAQGDVIEGTVIEMRRL
jgi:hypothetical protein